MELPPSLRAAVDAVLEGVSLAALSEAAETLSLRYRGEVRDGHAHLSEEMAARAYLATRLPATFAATAAAFEAAALAQPDFAPTSLLDIGSGPGTAMWAAAEVWPGLERAELAEASPAIRRLGEKLAQAVSVTVRWRGGDAAGGLGDAAPADLVTAAYLINEIAEVQRPALVERLWALTQGLMVIVEPGTTAGWHRILAARTQLLGLGGHILAPCAHAQACPIAAPDWCHFSSRVARSRLHRQAKGATIGWEDEKSIYLAVSRRPAQALTPRVLAPPRAGKGHVALKLCLPSGETATRTVSKREGEAWRTARRLDWGDTGAL